MKSPRNVGPLLMLATVLAVTLLASPRESQLSLASMVQPTHAEADAGSKTFDRKGCKFGQRYSSYHRRCVLWSPLDFG